MAGTQFRLERGRLQLLMSTIDQENAISPNCNVIKLSALLAYSVYTLCGGQGAMQFDVFGEFYSLDLKMHICTTV